MLQPHLYAGCAHQFIPTSTLAMIDSSIGWKRLPLICLLANLVGAFLGGCADLSTVPPPLLPNGAENSLNTVLLKELFNKSL